jgi:hypothetical protein
MAVFLRSQKFAQHPVLDPYTQVGDCAFTVYNNLYVKATVLLRHV